MTVLTLGIPPDELVEPASPVTLEKSYLDIMAFQFAGTRVSDSEVVTSLLNAG